jgi:hypothetical protein
MKTPEEAVNEAVINPASRLMILLFGTWLVGSLYPIPETVFWLIRGPQVYGNLTVYHNLDWCEFDFIPIIGSIFSKTFLVSGPIALFCVLCSALDRWSWRKVTALSSLSTLSMNALDDWSRDADWMTLTLYQALIMLLVLVLVPPLRQA